MDRLGTLDWVPALDRPDLVGAPVAKALSALSALRPSEAAAGVLVAGIDPELADTAEFCAAYDVPLDVSANCVVLAARRGGSSQLAACVVLATTRADVNGVARRRLEARKASFAPMDVAVAESGMDYGGITPVGLPPGWPVLLDRAVVETDQVIVGSGLRCSKLALAGRWLEDLPGARVVDGLGLPVDR
jgi:prolyl-tRNA editing enzyme YbaK/EbsC (Cys-tRNA(Pro) deacylase)